MSYQLAMLTRRFDLVSGGRCAFFLPSPNLVPVPFFARPHQSPNPAIAPPHSVCDVLLFCHSRLKLTSMSPPGGPLFPGRAHRHPAFFLRVHFLFPLFSFLFVGFFLKSSLVISPCLPKLLLPVIQGRPGVVRDGFFPLALFSLSPPLEILSSPSPPGLFSLLLFGVVLVFRPPPRPWSRVVTGRVPTPPFVPPPAMPLWLNLSYPPTPWIPPRAQVTSSIPPFSPSG